MDWPGSAALAATVVSLMLLLSRLEAVAERPLITVILGLITALFGVLFIARELRCSRPILDLSIFANPSSPARPPAPPPSWVYS